MRNIALSTVWNSLESSDVEHMLADIHALHIAHIEINFRFPPQFIIPLVHAVNQGRVTVSSVHNYCPVPDDVQFENAFPDCYSLASTSEKERKKAVMLTKNTILFASSVNAKAVVVHSGYVEVERLTNRLIDMIKNENQDSKKFIRLRKEAVDNRASRAKEHVDSICTSYAELVPFAKEHNMKLGVENRLYYNEIPSPKELSMILNYFDNNVLGYWHDIGHAYILETLGFYPKHYYLLNFYNKMIGLHLHDIIAMKDHCAPFTGVFDWQVLKSIVLPDVIPVIEVHSDVKADDIYRGKERLLKEIFFSANDPVH